MTDPPPESVTTREITKLEILVVAAERSSVLVLARALQSLAVRRLVCKGTDSGRRPSVLRSAPCAVCALLRSTLRNPVAVPRSHSCGLGGCCHLSGDVVRTQTFSATHETIDMRLLQRLYALDTDSRQKGFRTIALAH